MSNHFKQKDRKFYIKQLTQHHLFWPIIALVALIVACQIMAPDFLKIRIVEGHLLGSPIDLVKEATTPMLLGIGMALVIATAGVDLSVGSVMAISVAVSTQYLVTSGTPSEMSTILIAILLGILSGVLVGAFNGFLVAGLNVQPFIATMVLMVGGRGIAMLITKGQITTVTSEPFHKLGTGYLLGIPVQVIISLIILGLLALLVRRTALGLTIESIGINPRASHLTGFKSKRILWIVYVITGILAAIAGILQGAQTMAADSNNIGLMNEMDAIMCVVLGGTAMSGGRFYLGGTVIGALLLSTIERAVVMFGLPSQTAPLFKAIILILVCVCQSERFRTWASERKKTNSKRQYPVAKGATA